MADNFDVIVIGAGPGGYVAAIKAAQLGLKTANVERDERLGGTCLLRGCIPTKSLLESAEVLELARHGEAHGVIVSDVKLDMKGVNAAKDKVVAINAKGVEGLFKKYGVTRVSGNAVLSGPGSVTVTSKDGTATELKAKAVILATGSAVKWLPGLKPVAGRVVSSDELLQNEVVPKSLIVLGAGAVGVEFASIYKRFGSEVTIVEALPHVLPIEDEDISNEMEKALRRRKIAFLTGAKMEKATVTDAGVEVVVADAKGASQTLKAEMLLVAVGRRPVTEGLGLEKFPKVKSERGFVFVNEKMQTGEPWLYAIGDIVALPEEPASPGTGGGRMAGASNTRAHPQLAHLAMHEGILAAEVIAGHKTTPINYDQVPGATYSDPEVASVGLTEKRATDKGYDVKVGAFPFSANPKARILGAAEGMVKIVSDKKYDEVLGVHIVGPRATEMIAEACALLRLEATTEEIVRTIHAHPTLSEAMGEAAEAVLGKPIHM